LPEVIHAGNPSSRLPGGLHGGQEEADQRRDDRDHDQQLDEGKATMVRSVVAAGESDVFHYFREMGPKDLFRN
jgi:hypothetical protein